MYDFTYIESDENEIRAFTGAMYNFKFDIK